MRLSDRAFARRIDVTSLQLFVAVCELGSIGRAAEREALAVSAVSKRLSDLETVVDAPLLYRHARGVDLTPAGESLLHHARAMLASLQKMQGELSEYAQGVRGHVRIHANISAIVQFLPEDLGNFMRAHPQVKIDLEEHLSAQVLRAVQDGGTDIGICIAGAHTPPRGLQTRPYRRDELALVVPRGHALARRRAVPFAAALQYDHVGLHTGSSINLAMRVAAQRAGAALRLRIQVTGLDAMCRMIDNGLGVGIMPRRAFELMSGTGRLHLIRLTDAWATREIALVARDFGALPLTGRQLVEHLSAPQETQP